MISQVYNEIAPIGFDFKVLEIQTQLAKLNLIEAIYGVCRVQLELRDDKTTEDKYLLADLGKKGAMRHERWYPQGNKNESNVDLSIDDSYSSRIFFLTKDPINTNPPGNEWGWPEGNPEIIQSFAIIMHCNMQKIKNLNNGLTNKEQVKLLILSSLNLCPLLIVKNMSENIDNVWKEFSMTETMNGFALYPFYCLRLECEIPYYPLGINGSDYIELPRYVTGWITSKINCIVVASNPSPNTQLLNNGDYVPIEYVLNGDNTITVPYLNSVSGISVLTYFSLNGRFYQGSFFINGKIDISSHGKLSVGSKLSFDINIPLWSKD